MAKRAIRKAIILTQDEYEEVVDFLQTGQEPVRVQNLLAYKRSRWKAKMKKFKVEKGEGLSFPNGIALYQLCRARDKLKNKDEINEWKIHVPPDSINKILCHFHPTDDSTTGIGAHLGVRKTYEQVSLNVFLYPANSL